MVLMKRAARLARCACMASGASCLVDAEVRGRWPTSLPSGAGTTMATVWSWQEESPTTMPHRCTPASPPAKAQSFKAPSNSNFNLAGTSIKASSPLPLPS